MVALTEKYFHLQKLGDLCSQHFAGLSVPSVLQQSHHIRMQPWEEERPIATGRGRAWTEQGPQNATSFFRASVMADEKCAFYVGSVLNSVGTILQEDHGFRDQQIQGIT